MHIYSSKPNNAVPEKLSCAEALSQLGNTLAAFFSHQNSVQIQKQQSDDETTWLAYDPRTEKRHLFVSENAARIWVENRHNH